MSTAGDSRPRATSDLSPLTLGLASLASVVATVMVSRFGLAGTVAGAAACCGGGPDAASVRAGSAAQRDRAGLVHVLGTLRCAAAIARGAPAERVRCGNGRA